MFGSLMIIRNRSRKPISTFLMGASAVRSVTGPLTVFTVLPSILTRRSATFSAMRSTTLSFTASRSVADTDARTAFSAHSAFRPRSVAMVRAKAAASFSIFFALSLSICPPPTATGCAAPMFVAGAMAATCAAMVMKTPAEGDGADDAVDLDQRDGLGCPRRRQPEDDEHKRKNGDEEPLHGSRLTR